MPLTEAYFNIIEDIYYRPSAVRDAITGQFDVTALHGIGIDEDSAAEFSLGALLLYISETQRSEMSHIRKINIYSMGQQMSLDKATIKNLELTETILKRSSKVLFWAFWTEPIQLWVPEK